jgi:hypothetical protein
MSIKKHNNNKFDYFNVCPIIKDQTPVIILCNEHTIDISRCKAAFSLYNAYYLEDKNSIDLLRKPISKMVNLHSDIIFIKPIFKYVPNVPTNTIIYNENNKSKLFWNTTLNQITFIKSKYYFEYIIKLNNNTLDSLCNIISDHPNWFLWEALNTLYSKKELNSTLLNLDHKKPKEAV